MKMPFMDRVSFEVVPTYREIRDRRNIPRVSISITESKRSRLEFGTVNQQNKFHHQTSTDVKVVHQVKLPLQVSNFETSGEPKPLTRKERKKIEWKKFEKKKRERKRFLGHWSSLPDLVLEKIYQNLPQKDKFRCSQVCYNWSRVFHLRSVWTIFSVEDDCMTRYKYNYPGGFYHKVLDHASVMFVLQHLMIKVRHLKFLPRSNLFIVCGFLSVVLQWCSHLGGLPNIEALTFKFPCNFSGNNVDLDIRGTGGAILEDFKALMLNIENLKVLQLVDLHLDDFDAHRILEDAVLVGENKLTTLKLVNLTRQPMQISELAKFKKLQSLYISPHNLGSDLLIDICKKRTLKNLVIVTNSYTQYTGLPVNRAIWNHVRAKHEHLRVHLVTEGKRAPEIQLQEGAPVKSIVVDSPHCKVNAFFIYNVVDVYKDDLECVAYCGLPKYHMQNSFHERIDGALFHLVRSCPNLKTLVIREKISSSTVLLIAKFGRNLEKFIVRKNAIVLKCDWPENLWWDDELQRWLKTQSRSYQTMEEEMSRIFGYRWHAFNDKEFKNFDIKLE